MMKRFLTVWVILGVMCAVSAANAAITTYDNEADFLNATGLTDFESFETLPPSSSDSFTSVSTPSFDVTSNEQFMQIWGDPPVSFAQDGDQVLFWYAATQGSIVFDNFTDGEIYTFGLYITDWASSISPGIYAELIFVNENEDSYVIAETDTSLGDYQEIFFGVVSDSPFTSATLITTADDGWVFFDKVYTTDAVPVPSTLGLMAMGLVMLARVGRKER